MLFVFVPCQLSPRSGSKFKQQQQQQTRSDSKGYGGRAHTLSRQIVLEGAGAKSNVPLFSGEPDPVIWFKGCLSRMFLVSRQPDVAMRFSQSDPINAFKQALLAENITLMVSTNRVDF